MLRECPKKVASLIDLVNLPTPLRNFSGQSQMSHLSFFIGVWSYIKQHNLQVLLSLQFSPNSSSLLVMLLAAWECSLVHAIWQHLCRILRYNYIEGGDY
jgi:SWIB/MDM2 domain